MPHSSAEQPSAPSPGAPSAPLQPAPASRPRPTSTARWNPDAPAGSAPPKGMHLRVDGVSHSYGTLRVLTNINLVVPAGRPTGLLGENGSGKSTLLRIIAGIEKPTQGVVKTPKPLGFLRQDLPHDPRTTTIAMVVEEALAESRRLERLLAEAGEALETDPSPAASARYDQLLARARIADAWNADSRADEILHGLGLADVPRERLLAEISGGQRGRLALAHLLIARPTTLLLDEPTNHLDETGAQFLARILGEHPGPVLVASHDRAFLDDATRAQLDLDPSASRIDANEGGLTAFTGTFTDYFMARLDARERWEKKYRLEQEELVRLRQLVEDAHEVGDAERPPRTEARASKKFYADRNASVVSRRVRNAAQRLEILERTQVRQPPAELHFTGIPGRSVETGQPVITAREVAVTGRLAPISLEVQAGEKLLITGPNGSGKSTLLSVLAGVLAPTGGGVEVAAELGVLAQDELLDPDISVRTLLGRRADDAEAPDLMGLVHEKDLDRPLHELSRGQQRRAELARLLQSPPSVLLLDEPTNHLSLDLATRLERAVLDWGGTVVIASHDRWLRARWEGRRIDLGAAEG